MYPIPHDFRWASAEWAHARGQFMDTIGHKVHQWEGRHSKLPAVSSSAVGNYHRIHDVLSIYVCLIYLHTY